MIESIYYFFIIKNVMKSRNLSRMVMFGILDCFRKGKEEERKNICPDHRVSLFDELPSSEKRFLLYDLPSNGFRSWLDDYLAARVIFIFKSDLPARRVSRISATWQLEISVKTTPRQEDVSPHKYKHN